MREPSGDSLSQMIQVGLQLGISCLRLLGAGIVLGCMVAFLYTFTLPLSGTALSSLLYGFQFYILVYTFFYCSSVALILITCLTRVIFLL